MISSDSAVRYKCVYAIVCHPAHEVVCSLYYELMYNYYVDESFAQFFKLYRP